MPTAGGRSADSQELRRYLRDIAALTALPAVWLGADRRHIAESLADVLVKVLAPVVFITVRLEGRAAGETIEAVRTGQGQEVATPLRAIGGALDPWLAGDLADAAVLSLPHPFADGKVQAAVAPIGYGCELGALVAASDLPGFPTAEDRLLLGVAANQAGLVLQRLQVEEAQSSLAAIVESSEDAIVSKTLAGVITSWNAGAERLFGYTPAEAVGQSITLIVPPDRRHEEDMILERLRRGERIDHYETVRIAKDQRLIDVSLTVSPVRDGAGRIIGASKIARDISGRKAAAESLRRLAADDARLASILNTTPDLVGMAGLDQKVIFLNRAGREMLGLGDGEDLGAASPLDFHAPESARRMAEEALPAALRDGVWRGESTLRSRHGQDIPVLQVIFTHRGTDGEVIFATIARDISERKQAEASLLRAKEAADQANRARTMFLANMSHELRTPLNSIIGFSEVLALRLFGELNARQADYVANIAASGRHLLHLIDDVLDLAKIDAGRHQLELAKVKVGELLARVASSVEGTAGQKNLDLEVAVEPGLPVVYADLRRLRQILLNLLANAIKFTPPGGSVTLAAARSPAAGGDAEPRVRISVQDTGIGIARQDQGRLFQPFVQLEANGGEEHQGSGLGLALARQLVELHGGRIWVESGGAGLGSTFIFELPVRTEGGRRRDRRSPAARPA